MIHPDFHRVCHLAPVLREARKYLNLWRAVARSGKQHADDWKPVKDQETRVNLAVEKAMGGL